MRSLELARRNFKEVWRDPLSLGITIALPVVLLLVLQAFGEFEDIFEPTSLTPGIALFGFVMLMFSSAMILSRDREDALFARLLTAPLSARDFIAAYSLVDGIGARAAGTSIGFWTWAAIGNATLFCLWTAARCSN